MSRTPPQVADLAQGALDGTGGRRTGRPAAADQGVAEAPAPATPQQPAAAPTAGDGNPSGGNPSGGDLRALARAAWQADPTLTGAELAARYGKSERWGRDQIAAARNGNTGSGMPRPRRQGHEPAGTATTARQRQAAGNGNGNRQPEAVTARRQESGGTTGKAPASGRRQRQPAAGNRLTRWLASMRGARLNRLIANAVGIIAAVASYGHMREVALMAGETPWIAWLVPATVDGLAFAAWRQGQRGRFWLAIGMTMSVAANVLTDYPEVVEQLSWAIKAVPPVTLFGIHQLVHNTPFPSPTSNERR